MANTGLGKKWESLGGYWIFLWKTHTNLNFGLLIFWENITSGPAKKSL